MPYRHGFLGCRASGLFGARGRNARERGRRSYQHVWRVQRTLGGLQTPRNRGAVASYSGERHKDTAVGDPV